MDKKVLGGRLGSFPKRVCIVCKKDYSPSGGGQRYCSKICRLTTPYFKRLHSKRNKTYRYKNRGHLSHKRKRRKCWLDAYKVSRGCYKCGYKEHAISLDFDHINPYTKVFTIGSSLMRHLPNLIKEIRKCRVVCSNCHRYETYHGFTQLFRQRTKEKADLCFIKNERERSMFDEKNKREGYRFVPAEDLL